MAPYVLPVAAAAVLGLGALWYFHSQSAPPPVPPPPPSPGLPPPPPPAYNGGSGQPSSTGYSTGDPTGYGVSPGSTGQTSSGGYDPSAAAAVTAAGG